MTDDYYPGISIFAMSFVPSLTLLQHKRLDTSSKHPEILWIHPHEELSRHEFCLQHAPDTAVCRVDDRSIADNGAFDDESASEQEEGRIIYDGSASY